VPLSVLTAPLRVIRTRLQRSPAARAALQRLPPSLQASVTGVAEYLAGQRSGQPYRISPPPLSLPGRVGPIPRIHRTSLIPTVPSSIAGRIFARMSERSTEPGAPLNKISLNLDSQPWPIPDRLIPFGMDASPRLHLAAFAVHAPLRNLPRPRISGWEVRSLEAPPPELISRRADRYRITLQRHLGVVDSLGVYVDDQSRAHLLATAAAVGTPVILSDIAAAEPFLRDYLGARAISTMSGLSVSDLIDPSDRVRIAYAQWAAVHDHLGMTAHWHRVLAGTPYADLLARRPSVSVILATNRPEMISNWAPQLAVQDWENLEVIAVLHGDAFSPADEQRITATLGDKVRVLRQSAEVPLGALLATASEVAEGDMIVKWDDDDLYSRTHIADLVRTHRYSGATLVGKACEYVYLSGVDVTVQRVQGPREALSTTMAGGTLCIARADLAELGNWVVAPKRVDSLLIEKVMAAGGNTYRALGFGYVMTRATDPASHTWSVSNDTFLRANYPQRRGLATDWAMVDPPEEVLNLWRR
jgi:hypothetical protein